jgi:hypothetical protein
MLDYLGDRDYDSFGPKEHDLLKKKIGYGLFGPPQDIKGYNKKQNETVDLLFNIIKSENGVAKYVEMYHHMLLP